MPFKPAIEGSTHTHRAPCGYIFTFLPFQFVIAHFFSIGYWCMHFPAHGPFLCNFFIRGRITELGSWTTGWL